MIKKTIDKKIFRCPACGRENLLYEKNIIKCDKCNDIYRYQDNKFFFISKRELPEDFVDRFKYRLKKFSVFYNFLVKVISPVYVNNRLKKFIETEINKENSININLGSGNKLLSQKIINVDLLPYKYVDIVADIHRLPIANKKIDTIICEAVLEHVVNPYEVVKEINRVLKKGGLVYCFMPFICGFHASPTDYTRLTHEGVKVLFKDFEVIELGIGGGPTSGLLWILQEWLAIVLSFGFKKLHFLLYLFFMLVTFPIKYLDIILAKHPMAKNIASGFYIIARK
ncbi:MAG: class I SAM-dependent methyltransferase [Actinomycetota bacterium]